MIPHAIFAMVAMVASAVFLIGPRGILVPNAASQLAVPVAQGYWIDPANKLMWTVADNGSGLSRSQAIRYCRELRSGGFQDWALPTIDHLQGLFEKTAGGGGYHIRGPLKLTGWQWSATPGAQSGEGWAFDFGDGGRASVAAGDSGLNRALCVRQADN